MSFPTLFGARRRGESGPPPPPLPGPADAPTLTVTDEGSGAGDAVYSVAFSLPEDATSVNITEFKTDEPTSETDLGNFSTSPHEVTSVGPGDYYCTIKGVNVAGVGPESDPSNSITIYGEPGTPDAPTATVNASGLTVDLSSTLAANATYNIFTGTSDDGGSFSGNTANGDLNTGNLAVGRWTFVVKGANPAVPGGGTDSDPSNEVMVLGTPNIRVAMVFDSAWAFQERTSPTTPIANGAPVGTVVPIVNLLGAAANFTAPGDGNRATATLVNGNLAAAFSTDGGNKSLTGVIGNWTQPFTTIFAITGYTGGIGDAQLFRSSASAAVGYRAGGAATISFFANGPISNSTIYNANAVFIFRGNGANSSIETHLGNTGNVDAGPLQLTSNATDAMRLMTAPQGANGTLTFVAFANSVLSTTVTDAIRDYILNIYGVGA